MTLLNISAADAPSHAHPHSLPALDHLPSHTHISGVSWGAIFAGAAAAAALSLILLILGTGLGLSAVSPWKQDGISAAAFGLSTILWITFTQLMASGMGGYLAGRLRTKWMAIHTDEVYFRDTAHGFLAWAVASLATAALLTGVIGSIVSGGVQAGSTVAGGAATGVVAAAASGSTTVKPDADIGPLGYFVDSLFRAGVGMPGNTVVAAPPAPTTEASRIFANAMRTGPLPTEDVRYLGQIVAQRTGIPQADAEKRVTDTYAQTQARLRDAEMSAKEAADKARKASAYAALWLFISLLMGAFIASLSATYGGRRRDA